MYITFLFLLQCAVCRAWKSKKNILYLKFQFILSIIIVDMLMSLWMCWYAYACKCIWCVKTLLTLIDDAVVISICHSHLIALFNKIDRKCWSLFDGMQLQCVQQRTRGPFIIAIVSVVVDIYILPLLLIYRVYALCVCVCAILACYSFFSL